MSRVYSEWNAHQRAGHIAIRLYQGEQMTMNEIAKETEMTYQGSKFMMEMLSLILPISVVNGKWQWMRSD